MSICRLRCFSAAGNRKQCDQATRAAEPLATRASPGKAFTEELDQLRQSSSQGAGISGRSSTAAPRRSSPVVQQAQPRSGRESRHHLQGHRQGRAGNQQPGLWRPSPNRRMPSELPDVWALVVVEGAYDAMAVERAVQAKGGIFVLHGAPNAASTAVAARLAEVANNVGTEIVVLMDADVAGRQGRRALDEGLRSWEARSGSCPPVLHAFMPCWLSAARVDGRHMGANIGVEHAGPPALRAALARARPSRVVGGGTFTVELLQEMGLASPFKVQDREQANTVRNRRELCCAYLGLGTCSGSAMVKALNRYNFSLEEVQAATTFASKAMDRLPFQQYRKLMACNIYEERAG